MHVTAIRIVITSFNAEIKAISRKVVNMMHVPSPGRHVISPISKYQSIGELGWLEEETVGSEVKVS